MGLLVRIFISLFVVSLCLYLYINKLNEVTELRLAIPPLAKQVERLEEETKRLEYAVDTFESPIHLMRLAREPEYSGLEHPYRKDIIILPEGDPQVFSSMGEVRR